QRRQPSLRSELRLSGYEAYDGQTTHARTRQDDSGEIQRVRIRERYARRFFALATNRAQQIETFGPRKLLTGETRDEAPSPNLATRLQFSKYRKQISPWRC